MRATIFLFMPAPQRTPFAFRPERALGGGTALRKRRLLPLRGFGSSTGSGTRCAVSNVSRLLMQPIFSDLSTRRRELFRPAAQAALASPVSLRIQSRPHITISRCWPISITTNQTVNYRWLSSSCPSRISSFSVICTAT